MGVVGLDGDGEKAEEVAGKLLACFQAPFEVGEQQLYMSASLGMSIYPNDARDPDTLVQHADTAMHAAKELGRRRYKFFSAQMNRRVVERLALEGDLRSALDNKEFFLVYQPRVAVKTGAVEGVEALIRWRHPRLGLLMPDHFLPAAEESGLIVPIGRQVLEMACSQIKDWLGQGGPGQAGGGEPLGTPVLGGGSYRHDHRHSGPLRPYHRALRVGGHRKRSNGHGGGGGEGCYGNCMIWAWKSPWTISAPGYSSLYYLKELPIDTLKIDKSFITQIPDDHDSTTIVATVAALAHGLGMGVVVEGVETLRQLNCVAGFGCEQVQGYYFSRPISPDEVSTLLKGSACPFADKIPGKA